MQTLSRLVRSFWMVEDLEPVEPKYPDYPVDFFRPRLISKATLEKIFKKPEGNEAE